MTRRVVLDVSSFQPGNIDWARIHRESGGEVVGGIVKATEGGWKFSNPYFEQQVDGLHAAELVAGSYSFEHPGIGGTSDAELFLQRITGLDSSWACSRTAKSPMACRRRPCCSGSLRTWP